MNTGLYDKSGTPINIGDKTRLVLGNGDVREFDVCFKTVKRTRVKTLPGFEPKTTEVSITGIFFCWEGYDLLPCVDENGISDVEKMEVINKRFDTCNMKPEICQWVNEMATYICDDLCGFPILVDKQDELEELCAECRMSGYLSQLVNLMERMAAGHEDCDKHKRLGSGQAEGDC